MKYIFLILSAFFVLNISAQVNLQSGSAAYQLQIYSFNDSKSGLSTSVSLNYSSGNGLVVNDQAGNTGQNWTLLAGGYIVRKQYGEPDDQSSLTQFPAIVNGNIRGFNQENAMYDEDYQSFNWSGDPWSRFYVDYYYPNGFMFSEFPVDMVDTYPGVHNTPKELALIPRFKSNMDKKYALSRRAQTDRQQDVFVYNFNGVTGEFVIGKDGNILLLNSSKLIITKTVTDITGSPEVRTKISEFTIKDVSGILYKFRTYDYAQVLRLDRISVEGPNSFRKVVMRGNGFNNQHTIQKWWLTEIVNPVTNEKITFGYEYDYLDYISGKNPSYQYTEGQTAESVQIYEERTKGVIARLKNIFLPDNHIIQFNYDNSTPRVDVPNDRPLTEIKISYNAPEVTTYKLTYGYFLRKQILNYTDPISEGDKRFARLCLTSVQKTGGGMAEPPFKFTYYTGSESGDPADLVPPFDCMAQDHWGFYNKASIINVEEANPTKETLKNLLLNYSTYRAPSAGAARFGLLKGIETPFGGKYTFEYEQNDSKDADAPSVTKVMGGVRVFRVTTNDAVSSANDVVSTYTYKLADGTTSGWGYEEPTYLNRREIKIWNASTTEGYTEEGVLVFSITTSLAKFVVKEVAKQVLKIVLKAIAEKAAIAAAPSPVLAIAAYVIGGLIDRLFVLFNPSDYVWTNVYSYYSYQYQNGLGINYSRVEVANTSIAGGTGRTVEEFTAPANVRSEIPALAMPYSPKQRFAGWKYGLPSKTLVYDNQNNLVRETINSYQVTTNIANSGTAHKSCKVEVIRPESANCWAASYNLPLTDFSWEYYYPLYGGAQLTSTIEKNYSGGLVVSEMEISHSYNGDYFESESISARSNGDLVKTKRYYVNDYANISTAIQQMKTLNMLALPVATEVWIRKPNNNEFLIDATINEYILHTNGEVKLKRIYKLESLEPVYSSVIGYHNPNSLVRNSTYFKEQISFNYDNNGVLTETITSAGRINSQLYDYNQRMVTADVDNALQSEIAYSSFEAESKGGWTYNQNQVTGEDGFVTGLKCLRFSSGSGNISRSVSSSKPFILSLWAKGTMPVVNKDASVLSPVKTLANSVTGWTYYEFEFTGSGNITVSKPTAGGSTAITDVDELRLYPKDARMNTAAFDPARGKITECDENNRVLYYEYDGLSRMRLVKDENKNVLKTYEYNYKQ